MSRADPRASTPRPRRSASGSATASRVLGAAHRIDARGPHGAPRAPLEGLLADSRRHPARPHRRSSSAPGPGRSPACGSAWSPAVTMGHALGIPVHGVCSLDVLAHQALCRECGSGRRATASALRRLLVATDARRKEVYWARYRVTAGPDGAEAVERLDRAGRRPPGRAARGRAGAAHRGPRARCSTPTCSRTPLGAARRRCRRARAGSARGGARRAADAGRAALPAPPRRADHRRAGSGVVTRRCRGGAGRCASARGPTSPALAALEARPLRRTTRGPSTTWWAELAGRPRRDYVVLDDGGGVRRVCRARPRRRRRRRHDGRGRPAGAQGRSRAAAARRAGARAAAPWRGIRHARGARRQRSPPSVSTSAAGTPC